MARPVLDRAEGLARRADDHGALAGGVQAPPQPPDVPRVPPGRRRGLEHHAVDALDHARDHLAVGLDGKLPPLVAAAGHHARHHRMGDADRVPARAEDAERRLRRVDERHRGGRQVLHQVHRRLVAVLAVVPQQELAHGRALDRGLGGLRGVLGHRA